MPEFLPYGRQLIEDDDVAAVVTALRSERLAHGPLVAELEGAFAAAVDAKAAVACSSGTAALHLAYAGLDVGPGDLVVVPAITFLATATAALFCGAEVVFADVDPGSGLMTPDTLADAIGRAGGRVKAVAPVHLGGRICDVAALSLVARAAGACIIEDAPHAVGGRDALGRPVGACVSSEAAAFSLHPVKTLAAGEGGVVTLNDPERAERLRRLRNHGVTHEAARFVDRELSLGPDGQPNPWSYEQAELGFNYRMDEMSAALGRSQLSKLSRFAERRRRLAAAYDLALQPLAPLVRPASIPADGQAPCLHVYQVRIDFQAAGTDRGAVMRRLTAKGIWTQVHYIPVHRQPVFCSRGGELHLPGAEAFYARTLTLPLFPAMADADVERVVAALSAALEAPRP